MGNAITRTTLFFLLFTPFLAPGDDGPEHRADRSPTLFLKEQGFMDSRTIPECSGIVKSRNYPDLFWVISDSGNLPAVYPIRADGTLVLPDGENSGENNTFPGIRVAGEKNIDWEDITADNRGNLIIADTGNNRYNRDDLAIILVPEPDPYKDSSVSGSTKISFRYPETKPGKTRSYDSEAVFWSNGSLYLLTKQLAGYAWLYRFPSLQPGKPGTTQVLTFVGSLYTEGMVTAADVDTSRNELAVLTYSAIWIFETGPEEAGFENWQEKAHLPIAAGQCEAVCFSGNFLIITNEQGGIFTVPLERRTK